MRNAVTAKTVWPEIIAMVRSTIDRDGWLAAEHLVRSYCNENRVTPEEGTINPAITLVSMAGTNNLLPDGVARTESKSS